MKNRRMKRKGAMVNIDEYEADLVAEDEDEIDGAGWRGRRRELWMSRGRLWWPLYRIRILILRCGHCRPRLHHRVDDSST